MVVGVVFKSNFASKVYYYHPGDFDITVMDKVLVPVGDNGHIEVATVVSVMLEYVTDIAHAIRVNSPLKTVIAPADRNVLLRQMDAELDENRRQQEEIKTKYNKLLEKVR